MERSAALKRLAIQEDGQVLTNYIFMFGVVIFSLWMLINASGLESDLTAFLFSVTTEALAGRY